MNMTIELPMFEHFDSIQHQPLKVYNRVVMMNNLANDAGPEVAKAYIEGFTEDERKQMYIMLAYIQAKGVDAARKAVTRGLEVVNDAA